jgi:hypothetical protein
MPPTFEAEDKSKQLPGVNVLAKPYGCDKLKMLASLLFRLGPVELERVMKGHIRYNGLPRIPYFQKKRLLSQTHTPPKAAPQRMKMVIPGILTLSGWRSEVEPSWRLEPFSKEQFSGQMTKPHPPHPGYARPQECGAHVKRSTGSWLQRGVFTRWSSEPVELAVAIPWRSTLLC